MSEILLTTKFYIPPLRDNLVNRPHLIRRLNDGIAQQCRLTLISAPAGFGKSTLLSEWVSQVDVPAAWLSLEKGENTPGRFWRYFFTALSSIPHVRQSGAITSILQALQSRQAEPMEALLTNFLNAISELESGAILALDDFHAITESQIHENLIYLIDHLPRAAKGLHLVIASRMDPPWPLARWRARGELNELRPSDLRFGYEETVHFLSRILGLKLSQPDVAALQDRTEGWIAGLQMAALSMQGRLKDQGYEGVSHFIETFTGSHKFILDYLIEEVVSQQPAELRDFIHQTSILEQISAPLCDVLTGRQESQMMLEQVERANLFLFPLDDERKWYRYHHLFAELLQKRLKLMQPDQFCELHRAASQWYAQNDMLSEAISHAMMAEDYHRVNELVSGNALAMLERAELLDVLMHFERIPERQMGSRPWLGVAYAWTKAYVDPSADMERLLQQVEKGFSSVENPVEKRHLTSHLDAIRAYVSWVHGKADEALAWARKALEYLPEDDWMARNHILNIEGLAFQYKLDLDMAIHSFEAAIAAGHKTGRIYETYHAYANLAFALFLQGRLREAFALCQHVLGLVDQAGEVAIRKPVLAYAYATMSQVQLDWNELQPAISNARHAVALAEQWNQADTVHYSLTCISNALRAAGELEEAFAANQRAMQLAANVSPWFFRISAFEEIELLLARGEISAAACRFAEIESIVEERDRRGKYLVAKAALLNAQGRFAETLVALEEPVSALDGYGTIWPLMSLLPLQALALQALGQEAEAIDVIARCLALAEPEGWVRIFLEGGASMYELLQTAMERGIQAEFVGRLISAFQIPTAPHSSESPAGVVSRMPGSDLIEPLSERELEVLRYLNTTLTVKEISEELYVAPSTIHTHVRNVYGKLGVHSRIAAIRKAGELGLI